MPLTFWESMRMQLGPEKTEALRAEAERNIASSIKQDLPRIGITGENADKMSKYLNHMFGV